MTIALSPIIASRLQEAATDNSSDRELEGERDCLVFARTQCPLRVLLGAFDDAVFLAASSQHDAARATLRLDHAFLVCRLADRHRRYLPWHRERPFKHGENHG